MFNQLDNNTLVVFPVLSHFPGTDLTKTRLLVETSCVSATLGKHFRPARDRKRHHSAPTRSLPATHFPRVGNHLHAVSVIVESWNLNGGFAYGRVSLTHMWSPGRAWEEDGGEGSHIWPRLGVQISLGDNGRHRHTAMAFQPPNQNTRNPLRETRALITPGEPFHASELESFFFFSLWEELPVFKLKKCWMLLPQQQARAFASEGF